MKRTLLGAATLVVMVTSAALIYADIARPKPTSTPLIPEGRIVLHTGLRIVPQSNIYEARLQISQQELKDLQAALAGVQAGNPSLGQRIAQSSTRTIIAGLFFFLSISFAGVWLSRSPSRRSHKVAATALLVAVLLGAATIITRANAGPPGYVRWAELAKNLNDGKPTAAGVDIEIVPEGHGMTLVIPFNKAKGSGGEE